jgi:hypothetical protein
VKTTIATLPERLKGIDFVSLTKPLRDAVATTSRLDLEYIWIDSLCILQDSQEEKPRDITQMDRICSHAYATLSASSASHVTEGFLGNRQVSQFMTPISLRYLTRSGVEINLLMCEDPTPRDIEDLINTYGWTFHERGLPPSLIYFSKKNLIVSASSPLQSEGKDNECEWSSLVAAY